MLTPRSDPKSESSVIGSIIIDSSVLDTCRDLLQPEFFYSEANRKIFKLLVEMGADRKPIDSVTVAAELRGIDQLDAVGGNDYLLDCVNVVSHAPNAAYYAKYVAGFYYDREIVKACRELAMDQEQELLVAVTKLVQSKQALDVQPLFNYKTDLLTILDRITAKKTKPLYHTGISVLDSSIGGMMPGEINTWCAATNVGKSLMLLNLMDNAAAKSRCLYVGTEMAAASVVDRHISIVSGIQPYKIKTADLNSNDIVRIHNAMADVMSNMSVSLLDHPEPALKDIEAAIVRSKAEVVFLDYLERFTMPREENLRLKIKEFMRRLKTMAVQRGVIVHLASQLNRAAYGQEETRPTMANISESSAVEKESDRIIMLWTPRKKQENLSNSGILECIIAKNRHGSKGLIFDLRMDHLTLKIEEDRHIEESFV